jgi:hypothetical protein
VLGEKSTDGIFGKRKRKEKKKENKILSVGRERRS